MSDVADALAEAFSLNKRLAATRLARKQELEAELERLRGERANAAADARPEVQALLLELDARLGTLSTELAVVDREYQAARAEMAELQKIAGRQGGAAVVAALTSDDPVLRSAEEIALDNARAHLADLDAEARLDAELAGRPAAAVTSAAASRPALTREEADAQARAEFEELRAKRAQGDAPAGAAPGTRPKKTL